MQKVKCKNYFFLLILLEKTTLIYLLGVASFLYCRLLLAREVTAREVVLATDLGRRNSLSGDTN